MTQRNVDITPFQKACKAYAKAGNLALIPMTIAISDTSRNPEGLRNGFATARPLFRFSPQFLLIEPVKGMAIADIRFGNESQLEEPIPTSLYSLDEAMALFNQNPESPAWDRFRLPRHDLQQGNAITLVLRETEKAPEGTRAIRCFFFGKTGQFSPRETRVMGMVREIIMTADGPFVEIAPFDAHSSLSPVRFPVAAADLPALTARIGRPVKFILSLEE